MREPLVSVVVPMHNAEPYIAATLKSVLSETSIPLEVIVVDDRSTDASRARVNEINDSRVRVIEGPGRGISACLNTGLAATRGEIVMRCDADDLYTGHRIRRQVELLAENPGIDSICGAFATIDDRSRPVMSPACGDAAVDITDELRTGTVRTHLCTFAVRSHTMKRAGGFRAWFQTGEDVDMQLRLAEAGRVLYVPEQFYLYRLHERSVTHTKSYERGLFFERAARRFQQQRLASGQDDLGRGCPPPVPDLSFKKEDSASAHIQGMLLGRAWCEHRDGYKARALSTGLRVLTQNPANFRVWKSVVALALKPSGRRRA